MFCKSQIKLSSLRVDRVLLCGGGAALAGLCAYLQSAMGVPVELFDPFRVVDTAGLDPQAADLLEEYKLESVVALGLATMASDPEGYSVEILPESVRKRREFAGRTLWMIAAAVLGAALPRLPRLEDARGPGADAHGGRAARAPARQAPSRPTAGPASSSARTTSSPSAPPCCRGSPARASSSRARSMLLESRPARRLLGHETSRANGATASDLGLARGNERPILHLDGPRARGHRFDHEPVRGLRAEAGERLPGARDQAHRSARAVDKFTLDLTLFGPPPPPEGGPAEPETARADVTADKRARGGR